MTNFGKNIKKIRSIQKLSQAKFAEIFELSRASVGAYEEGRAEAKLEVITNIAKYFSISVDDLVNSEITVNKLYHFNIFDDKFDNKINLGAEVLKMVDFTQIPIVLSHDLLVNQVADCIKNAENHITLPHHNSNQLAILIDKNSFRHIPEALKENDILICSEIEIDNNIDLAENLWLLKTDKALYLGEIKKALNKALVFFPEKDAPSTIFISDIDFIVSLDSIITSNPKINLTDSDRISKLEHQVNDLYNRL